MSPVALSLLVLLLFNHTSTASAQTAFGFRDTIDFRHVQDRSDESRAGGVVDSVGSATADPVPSRDDTGMPAIVLVVSCVMVAVAIALVYWIKAAHDATARQTQQPLSGVDSTKANDSTYQHAFDLPHNISHHRGRGQSTFGHGGRGDGGSGVPFAPSHTKPHAPMSGFITIRPGSLLDRGAAPSTSKPAATISHTPHTPTMPPPPSAAVLTSESLVTEPRHSDPSGDVLRTHGKQPPGPFVAMSARRMSVASLLARHVEDFAFTPKHRTPPSPTTPPQLFSPHSPSQSPLERGKARGLPDRNATVGMPRMSTSSENDADAEVAM